MLQGKTDPKAALTTLQQGLEEVIKSADAVNPKSGDVHVLHAPATRANPGTGLTTGSGRQPHASAAAR